MAFTQSGLYVLTWIDILDATQLAVNLVDTGHKWALYTSSATVDFTADTAYTTSNEVSGTGYTAGGKVITGLTPTVSQSPTGTLKFDHDDISWANATFTARGGILYADTLTNNDLIVGLTFGADYTCTNGTFTIQFASGGIFTIDLTPA